MFVARGAEVVIDVSIDVMNPRVIVVGLALLVGCSQPPGESSDWVERREMSTARSEHPAVVLDEKIIVIGGLVETAPGRFAATSTVESYDPETNAWEDLPDLPEPRHHGMAAVLGDRLFSIGGFSEFGFSATSAVWELVGSEWVDRALLPDRVGAGAAVFLDGLVYVVGGVPGGGLLAYDPGADEWEVLTGPSVFREHLAAVAYEGEIWAIAGREPGRIHDTVEIYDPVSNSWRDGPILNEARSGFGAVVVNGSIYVAGGEVFDPNETLVTTERYDAGTGEWVLVEPLPIGLHGNPLAVGGHTLYVPGGSTRAGGVENAGKLLALELS